MADSEVKLKKTSQWKQEITNNYKETMDGCSKNG